MKRRLEFAPSFLKRAGKLLKKNPHLDPAFETVLTRLANNPFDPRLHPHPLTGRLEGKHACSLTYELRIVFRLDDDAVHLLDIGSHDEVYS